MDRHIETGNWGDSAENTEARKWEALKDEVPYSPESDINSVDPQELNRIARGSRNAGRREFDYYLYIRKQSKELGIPQNEMLAKIRSINKELLFGENKDNIKFYHSTGIDELPDILESGQLLSLKEREARGKDTGNRMQWSNSKNISFSFDQFNNNGIITESGFNDRDRAYWAPRGSEITFVFGGDLMNEDSFEPALYHPTVEKVSIAEKCLGIIVEDAKNVEKVESMLRERGIAVPVYSAGEFDTKASAKLLRESKKREQLKYGIDASAKSQTEEQPLEQTTEDNQSEKAKTDTQAEHPEDNTPEIEMVPPTPLEEQNIERNEGHRAELLKEEEVVNVIKLLAASAPQINSLLAILRGLNTAQAAGVLWTMSKDMHNQSRAFLSDLQSRRNLGEIELAESNYKSIMQEKYGYSMRAIQAIRLKAREVPKNMASKLFFYSDKIEENIKKVYSIISK